MQGIQSGLATRFCSEVPPALSVHCFAHNLNLFLQDAIKMLVYIRDILLTVHEISNLIWYSTPLNVCIFFQTKWSIQNQVSLLNLFAQLDRQLARQLSMPFYKIICSHWSTWRNSHDEYSLEAGGLQQPLEKFTTLKLCHLFSAAEQVSITLWRNDISLAEGFAAVETAK